MNLKASFINFLNKKYPELPTDQLNELIADNLLSFFQIKLSHELINSIKTEIKQYWKLREWGSQNLNNEFSLLGLRKPNNYSACMSYDFHVNADSKPELIEINTNASFLAVGLELYSFLNLKNAAGDFSEQDLVQMFLNEHNLAHQNQNADFNLAIIDENPQAQRLYIEFLIYQALFKKNNLTAHINDISELEKFKSSSLIYNRYTDFYLQEEKSKPLKDLYNNSKIELTPNPYEYFLLADKQRFIDWNKQTEIEKPKSLLATYDMATEDKDKMWSERKNLFFKPKNSFGSKQVYKGASISRKILEDVSKSNFIAQQVSPAPEVEVLVNGIIQKMKYDLRCFAYKDELQLIIARLYQGQTTNLRTEGGGFACVVSI